MPKRTTIYRWRKDYPDFGNAYLLAQEEHIDALVDETGEIVDSEPDAQRARVRVDYRKWLASRLNRQKYGDKINAILSGCGYNMRKFLIVPYGKTEW